MPTDYPQRTRRRLLRWCAGGFISSAGTFRMASAQRLAALVPAADLPWAATEAPRLPSEVLRVGPGRELRTVMEAARRARDGDAIEIDAGDYHQQVATWPQSDLTVRAVGGRVRMIADGASAEGKAIWVIKGTRVLIENIDFSGARVPSMNGAGIRHEGGMLVVRGCLFEGNEIGLLTWNSPSAELDVESSEFRGNKVVQQPPHPDPGHQIYVGAIGRFSLRTSYVSRGAHGHLVKSRARLCDIFYNRITDEAGGHASYEVELANGGVARVVGNIIEQGARTENEAMVSFGTETYRWPRNELLLAYNTLIDRYPSGGRFVRVAPGAGRVEAFNNLLVGAGTPGIGDLGNFRVHESVFASAARYDFRLNADSPLVGKAIPAAAGSAYPDAPDREYVHPSGSRPIPAGRLSPGAIQSLHRR